MKWKKTLADLGLTEDKVSGGLKKKIKDYYEIAEGIDGLKNALENDDLSDSDRDELEGDLQDLSEGLEESDKQLIRAIQIFDKNKDKYAELSKNLVGRGRPKKNAEPTVQTQSTPTSTPQPTSTPKAEVSKDGEKKKSGFGFVLVAIAVGVITLGAVNIFKNND
jgi:hypothetical protein